MRLNKIYRNWGTYTNTQMRKHLFKEFHAARRNISNIMFLIKFQACFKKMC